MKKSEILRNLISGRVGKGQTGDEGGEREEEGRMGY